MQILRSIIFLFLIGVCSAQTVKPNQEGYVDNPNIDVINKHLQENYKLNLFKKLGLILTGQVVKETDKNLNNRTYTNFKIEF